MKDGARKFLINSRQNTYASGNKPTIVNGVDTYIIKQDNLEYRDAYIGGEFVFQGQEILFEDNKPVWSMTYRGAAQKDTEPGKVFIVLQKFIKEYADITRFGEDLQKDEGEFRYVCKASGGISEFKGREEIYQNKKLAHWMDFFGGDIK